MALRSRSLLAIAAALLLAACGGKDEMLAPSPLPAFEQAVAVDRLWSAAVGGGQPGVGSRLAPAVTGETVYAVAGDGRLAAYAREDGSRRWQRDTGLPLSAGPVAAFNQLFVGTREGELVALSAADGTVAWRLAAGGEVLAPPVVDGDRVLAKNAGGRVIAVNRTDGAVLWRWEDGVPMLSLRAASRPQRAADAVFAGLPSGMLVALSANDGQRLWERRIAEPGGASELDRLVDIAGDFVIDGDRLYAAAWQGRVVALDLRNGQFAWQLPFSTHRNLALANGTLFGVDADSRVVAWRATDGVVLWRLESLLGRQLTGVATVGGYLVAGDYDGYLHVIRQADGVLVGRERVGISAIAVTPVVDDGVVFVQGRGGKLAAFRIE